MTNETISSLEAHKALNVCLRYAMINAPTKQQKNSSHEDSTIRQTSKTLLTIEKGELPFGICIECSLLGVSVHEKFDDC